MKEIRMFDSTKNAPIVMDVPTDFDELEHYSSRFIRRTQGYTLRLDENCFCVVPHDECGSPFEHLYFFRDGYMRIGMASGRLFRTWEQMWFIITSITAQNLRRY